MQIWHLLFFFSFFFNKVYIQKPPGNLDSQSCGISFFPANVRLGERCKWLEVLVKTPPATLHISSRSWKTLGCLRGVFVADGPRQSPGPAASELQWCKVGELCTPQQWGWLQELSLPSCPHLDPPRNWAFCSQWRLRLGVNLIFE